MILGRMHYIDIGTHLDECSGKFVWSSSRSKSEKLFDTTRWQMELLPESYYKWHTGGSDLHRELGTRILSIEPM